MKSCSECFHQDVWAGEQICSYIRLGLADMNQDHWRVRMAFRKDDPSVCPAAIEGEQDE